jgi:hypothetical protein
VIGVEQKLTSVQVKHGTMRVELPDVPLKIAGPATPTRTRPEVIRIEEPEAVAPVFSSLFKKFDLRHRGIRKAANH